MRAACAGPPDLHPGWLELLKVELHSQARSGWYVKDGFVKENLRVVLLGFVTHGGTVPPNVVPAMNKTNTNNQRNEWLTHGYRGDA